MKYISGYKNFINDLEDYLQEIFDKYSIKSFMTLTLFSIMEKMIAHIIGNLKTSYT